MAIQDQTSALRRVYVRAPRAEDLTAWEAYGWHAAPLATAATREHEALRAELAAAGAEVVEGTAAVPGIPTPSTRTTPSS